MPLRIKLLGSLLIENENTAPSEIMKWAKACALLAYLCVTQQAQTREMLADLLWDASSTTQSLQNLRKLLSRMRQWVPELEVTRKQVGYRMKISLSCDFFTLTKALTSGNTREIDEALQLYHGDLLDGFYLDDAPRFNEWLLVEREQLRQRVIAAYRRVCFAHAANNTWPKGVDSARRWLSLDMLDEEALRQLMQMLAANGQLEEALQQYTLCRQRLWDELGVEPEKSTLQLCQQLTQLKEQTEGQLPRDVIERTHIRWPEPDTLAELGPLPTLSTMLYQRNAHFTGRQESLLILARKLLPWPETREGLPRVLAITGMGGLGKTQLAVEFCYRYGRYFPGGVFWLRFANGNNVATEIASIGGERGMALYREADNLSQADKVGRVTKAWQDPIPRLLIFDNCEEAALLQKWLPVTGGCSVLLTSHQAYWVQELQMAELPLSVFGVAESVRLLQNLVPELADDDAVNISAELGYLPLALHLAGSFLRRYQQISAEQYLCQLREKTLLGHPSLQGRGTDFSPTDHELDVARTFAVNWEQLNIDDETDAIALKLLACAAQFAPGEPLPRDLLLATVVSDDVDVMQLLLAEDGLARLIALGFIKVNGENMLSLHRLVIAFVQRMVVDVAGVQTAVADTIWRRLRTQWETGTVLDQLVVSPAHVHFVMELELAKGTALAVHLAHVWARHLLDIGDFTHSRIYFEKALALCEKVYGADQSETADILIDLGTLTWRSDSEQAAWPHYQRAFTIYEQLFGAVHPKTASSLTTMAILYARTGDYDAAIANYQRALAIYAQVLPPDHQTVALTLYNLAVAYRRAGNYQKALSHYEESLRIRRTEWPDDNPHILMTLSGIGSTYSLMGNYQEAYEYCCKALLGRKTRLGDTHYLTALSLSRLGVALGFLGNYKEAISYLQQALKIRQKIFGKEHPQLVYTLTYLGVMLQEVGEMETARQRLEQGLAIQESRQLENEQTATTLTYLAALYMQMGDTLKAKNHLQRALAIWEQRQKYTPSQAATTFIYWGEWWEAQGDTHAALSYYEQALTILTGRVLATHRYWQRVQAHLARLKGER